MDILTVGGSLPFGNFTEQMSRKVSVRVLDSFSLLSGRKTKDMPCHKSLSNQRLDHCEMFSFYDNDGEEFYNPNAPTLMPNEDIWKKFELLPTPPRSPRREGISCNVLDEFTDLKEFLVKLPNLPFPETPPLNTSLCSNLIQDCMWSGSHTLSDCSSTEKLNTVTAPANGSLDLSHTSDCVDPTAVFPYPISDTQIQNLGTETPSDSEEEIDVVSTPDDSSLPTSSNPTIIHARNIKTVTVTTESTKPKMQSKSVQLVIECPQITGHHNYSLSHSHTYKRTRSVYHHQTPFIPKRIKRELSLPDLKSACKKLHLARDSGSRNNSDSDEFCEGGKRTQHNVLERKRRNDLKYSFFTLRDNVPDLNAKDKAPKVLILKKAADHILELRRHELKLSKELTVVKDRHEALRKTLSSLRH